MAIDTIESVTDAVDLFIRLPRVAGRVSVFRGHGNYDWKLKPLIERLEQAVQNRENDLVRELVAVAPNQFSTDVSMFDRLVRMQHFGLPTRLMDTTANPLVALFFATEELNDPVDGAVVILDIDKGSEKYFDSDTVSCIANLCNLTQDERMLIENTKAKAIGDFNALHAVDRLVQFVHAEKPSFRPRVQRADLFRRLHVIPKMNNPRIVAQWIIYSLWAQQT